MSYFRLNSNYSASAEVAATMVSLGIFEQIKQYILESFHSILWADVDQAAQFYELSSLQEKKNIHSRYSQITDSWVCILSFYTSLVYLFCCTQPLFCFSWFFFFGFHVFQLPCFVFHVFPSRTITQCHPPHTQTLRGSPVNIIVPWSHIDHFFGFFYSLWAFIFSIPGFGFCWALETRGFVHVGVLSPHDLFLQHLHWALPQGPPPSQWASLPPLKTLAYLLGWLQWPKIIKKYWKHKPHSRATVQQSANYKRAITFL